MQQALWFRTQEEDYLTLTQERRLTKGKKTLLRVLIEKTPAFSVKDFRRQLAKGLAKSRRAKNK
jgi:hypothetical protein